MASGRALHAAAELPLDAHAGRSSRSRSCTSTRPTARGGWTSRRAMPEQTYDTREEWEARIEHARGLFGRR